MNVHGISPLGKIFSKNVLFIVGDYNIWEKHIHRIIKFEIWGVKKENTIQKYFSAEKFYHPSFKPSAHAYLALVKSSSFLKK